LTHASEIAESYNGDQMNAGIRPSSGSPQLDEAAQRKVEAELDRILTSTAFRNARRSQELLRYIVNHTLANELDYLKERSIGANVFQRAPDYDTGDDSIVRVKASELRKRLAQYYMESPGPHDLQIDLPAGAYVPEFRFTEGPLPPASGRRRIALAAAAAAGLACGILIWRQVTLDTAFDRFWNPVLKSGEPVLLCLANPAVFTLHGQSREAFRREPYPASIPSVDIRINATDYAGIADAITMSQLSGFLNRLGLNVQVRTGNDTSFADLRNSPAILIGAFTNPWTLQMTKDLRFIFDRDPQGIHIIRDQMNPTRVWRRDPDHPTRDYLVLSRIFESRSGRIIITAAGIGQAGTQLSGEFLTNPMYLEQATRSAPADWPKRNLQLVIEGEVIGRTPGPPKVVESWYW
jgi:hypothetical protein